MTNPEILCRDLTSGETFTERGDVGVYDPPPGWDAAEGAIDWFVLRTRPDVTFYPLAAAAAGSRVMVYDPDTERYWLTEVLPIV